MKGARGSENTDANRRLAMLWGDKDTVEDPTLVTYTSSKRKLIGRELSVKPERFAYFVTTKNQQDHKYLSRSTVEVPVDAYRDINI